MTEALPAELRERLEKEVSATFSIRDLTRILLFPLERNLADIVVPRNKPDAVTEIFSASIEQGWLRPLLLALKEARLSPEKADFQQLVDEALALFPGRNRTPFPCPDNVALAPCANCWWRDVAEPVNEDQLIGRFRASECEMIRGPGLPELAAWTLNALTETSDQVPGIGIQIVDSANKLLEKAFAENADEDRAAQKLLRKIRILDGFDRNDNQANWAAVLSEANARGVKTLVALFLGVFIADGRIRSLADSNLQRLYKHSRRRRRDA